MTNRRSVPSAVDGRPRPEAALTPAALAAPTRERAARQRLLNVLAAEPDGLTVGALAERLGVHPNAVRKQLAALRAEGAVSAEPMPPSGRGRPGVRWRAAASGDDPVAAGHRELVRLLVGLVRQAGFTADEVEAFGADQGRLIGGPGGARALARAFERLGFAPEETAPASARRAGFSDLRLNACPFREAVMQPGGEVVCRLHRGLAAGLAEVAAEGGELVELEVPNPGYGGCRVRARNLGAAE